MNPTQSWVRFSLPTLLLGATLILLMSGSRDEALPPRNSLTSFPLLLGNWEGKDLQSSDELEKSLGPGEFLFRDYFDRRERTVAGLLIAYFPSQQTGDTIHTPKNCLPGSGWIPVKTSRIWIDHPGWNKIEVNSILVQKGAKRAMVLYWYQAHG